MYNKLMRKLLWCSLMLWLLKRLKMMKILWHDVNDERYDVRWWQKRKYWICNLSYDDMIYDRYVIFDYSITKKQNGNKKTVLFFFVLYILILKIHALSLQVYLPILGIAWNLLYQYIYITITYMDFFTLFAKTISNIYTISQNIYMS